MVSVAFPLSGLSARFACSLARRRPPEPSDASRRTKPNDGSEQENDEHGNIQPDATGPSDCPADCNSRRAIAAETVRRITERPTAIVECLGPMPNPYRDGESVLDTYADDAGNEYWFDSETGALVQMGPRENTHPPAHAPRSSVSPRPVKELRERAVGIISALVPSFAERRSSLHPLEDNRRGQVYFFRWDDFNAPLRETEMPPFVQVALTGQGKLTGFTNTLRS